MDFAANQPIVLDNGSGSIKAGFAGDEQPKSIFPSIVGRTKHDRVMAGALDSDFYVGSKAQELRGLLRLNYPMEHGIVNDWHDMEKIWQHVYTDELIASPEDHPLLLTEAPLNPYSHRQTAAQILFETFNVPAIFVGIQAVLALYASGRTTGVVLDSGDGVSHSVPVFEGFAIRNGIKRLDLGGRDVTRYLHHNLLRSGYSFTTSAEFDVVRQIKEKCCYVSLNPTREEKEYLGMGLATPQDEYVLPDGRTISLSTERFRAPEILFRPDLIGEEIPSLPTMLTDTIDKTDIDLRRSLYSNIVLSGGSTLLKGFGDRLLSEVKKNAMRDVKIRIYAPPERKYSTWIGGSILASLSTFKKLWVTSEEYQEDPDIVSRKML